MKIFIKILKALLVAVIIFVVGFAGLIGYALITDYNPHEKEVLYTKESSDKLNDSTELSILTWNIGYCGLDKDMDFFYDGGKKVMTPKDRLVNNLKAVENFLKQNDTADFIFIQEIDKNSKRSYHINEYDSVNSVLKNDFSSFGKNYDVFFVPVPVTSPMGKVLSGVALYSKLQPVSSVRNSFPGKYGFPKQLFMLDRCFVVNRYQMTNGKELVVVNTHNEAYDPGQIRKAQMEYLREFLLKEYEKGNCLILGGDWNQTPPDFKPAYSSSLIRTEQIALPSGYLPEGWQWIYDNTAPTNRTIKTAYDPATTTTTVIDFFLISPNVKAVSVKCINLGFENSDHNPVIVKVRLNK
jgi:endonuclease/exonuclease/phosphatase family metal-dependent hydrolase